MAFFPEFLRYTSHIWPHSVVASSAPFPLDLRFDNICYRDSIPYGSVRRQFSIGIYTRAYSGWNTEEAMRAGSHEILSWCRQEKEKRPTRLERAWGPVSPFRYFARIGRNRMGHDDGYWAEKYPQGISGEKRSSRRSRLEKWCLTSWWSGRNIGDSKCIFTFDRFPSYVHWCLCLVYSLRNALWIALQVGRHKDWSVNVHNSPDPKYTIKR
jgi:hypothetical protein